MTDSETVDLAAAWRATVDQYDAAAAAYAKNPTDRMARLAKRQAAERVDVMRTYWRGVGAAVGARPTSARTVGISISDNDGSV